MADTLPQPNPARLSAPAPFFSDNSFVRGDQTRENNSAIWENFQWLDFAGLANKNPIVGADYIGIWDSVAESYKYITYTQLLALLGARFSPIINYAKLSHTLAAGTNGGTATSGSFQTRTINTEDSDGGGIVSISSNQFTLQAGTYQVTASVPANYCGRHQSKLRNITDNADTILGSTEYSTSNASAYNGQSRSFIVGEFTIAGAKAFEIQTRVETTVASTGYGLAANFGVSEVYTVVEIWKVA